MKVIHWVVLGLIAIGALYLFHNYQMHGGTQGLRAGIGLA